MSALGTFGFGGAGLVSVGLGEDTVKLAHGIVGVGGKLTVSHLVSLNVSGLTDEAIAHVVAESLDGMGAKGCRAISIVPTQLVVTRNIEVPSVDRDEVRNIVVLQASRHTPYAREDIIVDYVNMGVYKDTYTRILLIVAGRNKVRRHLDILAEAGLRVERVLFAPEMVSRVTDRMLESESPEPLRGIIHVDESSTDFIVSDGPRPIFVRSFPIGARQLSGRGGEDRTRFTEEIRKSIDVYQSEEIEKKPSAFILTGAVESVRDVKAPLDEALVVPSQTVSYPQYLPIADGAARALRDDENVSYLDVMGSLHMREDAEVELLPEDMKSRVEFEERSRDVVKTGILAILLLLLVPGILFLKVAFKSMHLQRRQARYGPVLEEAESLKGDFGKIQAIRGFLARERRSLDVLGVLFDKLPDDARCTEIRYDVKGTFAVEGVAKTMESVNQLNREMRRSEHFQRVDIPRPKQREEDGLFEFEIKCDLVGKAEDEE